MSSSCVHSGNPASSPRPFFTAIGTFARSTSLSKIACCAAGSYANLAPLAQPSPFGHPTSTKDRLLAGVLRCSRCALLQSHENHPTVLICSVLSKASARAVYFSKTSVDCSRLNDFASVPFPTALHFSPLLPSNQPATSALILNLLSTFPPFFLNPSVLRCVHSHQSVIPVLSHKIYRW